MLVVTGWIVASDPALRSEGTASILMSVRILKEFESYQKEEKEDQLT